MGETGPEGPAAYRDFTIEIEAGDAPGAYRVSGVQQPGDQRPKGTFVLPPGLDDHRIDDVLEALETANLDEDTAIAFGTDLFHALFRGDIARVYADGFAAGGRGRLRLIIEPDELARLPWELLYDDRDATFLAVRGPVVRSVAGVDAVSAIEATRPLRVLVVDAFPAGVERLESELEAQSIKEALAQLGGDADVVTLERATLPRLLDTLRTAYDSPDEAPFHVLHFIGHGDVDGNGDNVLLFELDEHHQRDEVTPAELLAIIREYELKLVFLNACKSSVRSSFAAGEAFGPALVRAGIPAVVAMQASVLDENASVAAADFYAAIADNRPVDAALTDARRLLRAGDEVTMAGFGVPVCYLRSTDGRILDFPPRPQWWQTGRGRLIGAAVLAALVGLFSFAATRDRPVMNELEFNVAVAEFLTVDEDGRPINSTVGEDLAETSFEQIDAALAELTIPIGAWSPEQTGVIEGTTADDRRTAAEKLADDVNADLVFYGTVAVDGNDVKFQPEFLLNDRRLLGAREMTGRYLFGGEEQFKLNNIVSTGAVDERMGFRATALARLVEGLAHYALSDYDAALASLDAAAGIEGWGDVGGFEIVELFRGNTHARLAGFAPTRELRLAEFAVADGHYQLALAANPEYSRALIGRADVLFQKAHNGCEPEKVDEQGDIVPATADEDGLAAAEAAFEEARGAGFQPEVADVDAKISFGLARVYACQIFSDFPAGDAELAFQSVIDAYDPETGRLRELAWESYAGLAALHASRRTTQPLALDEYQTAIDLTTSDERRALFLGDQAWVYAQLGQTGAACTAYDEALRLTASENLRVRLTSQRSDLGEC